MTTGLRARRLARRPGVSAGREVVLGRGVQLDIAPGAQLRLGDGCRVGERTRIAVNQGVVDIGAGAVLGPRCTLVAHAGIAIGAGAQLAEGAVVVDFDHVIDDVERPIRAQPLAAAAVTIGAGAQIGLGACVLRGVTVGERATVGPHAVVTHDVAPRATVGGVPARPLPAHY